MKIKKPQKKYLKRKGYWDKKCCALWRQIVVFKAGNKCEVSGVSGEQKRLYAHHFIGRINKHLKFDSRNGVLLSYNEHVGTTYCAHNDPEGFREWFKDARPDDFEYLCEERKVPPKPFSLEEYEKTFEELKKELKNYE